MGEVGSWFCNCVISNCMNMLSRPVPDELELELALLLLELALGAAVVAVA